MQLTPYQLRVLTHTVLGEALPHDPAGQAAIAAVILNRAVSGQFPSDPAAVALQGSGNSHQFSAWNTGKSGNDNVRIPSTDPLYQAVERVVEGVANGTIPDPTNGATYYYAPKAMQPAGRVPGWAPGMTQTANIGGQLFFSPHPVPPADIPSNADSINGGVLQNPALMLPYPAPAPLTPPTGNVDPIGTGPGSFAALQAMLPQTAPPLPVNRPATPVQAAPVPMPTPSFAAPVVSPQTNLLRLPNGKMVAPGTYPSTDGSKTTFTVANDGEGNAVVTPNRIGLMAGIGPGTVAGSVVGQKLAEAVPQVQAAATGALDNAGKTIGAAKDAVTDFGSNVVSGARGFLSSLLSGSKAPSVPAPTSLAPAPTTRTISVANPAYAEWQASFGDPASSYRDTSEASAAYGDPAASYRDAYQAAAAPKAIVPPAPARFITKTVAAAPARAPIILPPQPAPSPNSGPAWITPQSGLTGAQTHAGLMAQQTDGTRKDQNGNTVIAMNGNAARANPFINSFGMIT